MKTSAFTFDYDLGIAHCAESSVRLTRHEADVLQALLQSRGNAIPMEVLIRRVYGVDEPNTARNAMHVMVHRLRRKLNGMGVEIIHIFQAGYGIRSSSRPNELADKLRAALQCAEELRRWNIYRMLLPCLYEVDKDKAERGIGDKSREVAAPSVGCCP